MKTTRSESFRRTKSVALSGMLSALCFVIMYVASVTDIFDLSAAVLCSWIIAIAVIEIGGRYPWLIWLVAGVLCMLLIPKKDVALEFVMFGGVYPMLKLYFEKLPQVFSWIAKILYFNAVFTGWFFMSKFLFGLDVGLELGVIAYAAANVFFVIVDVAFTLMITMYLSKLRPRIKNRNKK